MKPVRRAVSFAITNPGRSGRVLLVRRPLDDADLPGVWGLPAGSPREGESDEEAVLRAGREKLGVELDVGGELRRGITERTGYRLEMGLFEAQIAAGEPAIPQPHSEVTQYIDWRWGEPEELRPAAERGSLCSRLYLAVWGGEASSEERPRPFDSQPLLRGEHVELRPLRPQDFEELFAVASDPLIWEQHPDRSRHEERVFRAFFDEAIRSGGALAVIDRRSGRMIGSSRYHGYDGRRREVEIGWTFLGRSHWGGMYNGEVKRLMIAHAFRFVERVVFVVGPTNRRSQRALEKIGATRAGTRPDASGRDSHLYEITREPPDR